MVLRVENERGEEFALSVRRPRVNHIAAAIGIGDASQLSIMRRLAASAVNAHIAEGCKNAYVSVQAKAILYEGIPAILQTYIEGFPLRPQGIEKIKLDPRYCKDYSQAKNKMLKIKMICKELGYMGVTEEKGTLYGIRGKFSALGSDKSHDDLAQDPELRRSMMWIQLFTSLIGAADCTCNNILYKWSGDNLKAIAIDLEESFGPKTSSLSTVRNRESHEANEYKKEIMVMKDEINSGILNAKQIALKNQFIKQKENRIQKYQNDTIQLVELPEVVDWEMYNRYMDLNKERLTRIVQSEDGPLLPDQEVFELCLRLEEIQCHLLKLRKEKNIIEPTLEAWGPNSKTPSGEMVSNLLRNPDKNLLARDLLKLNALKIDYRAPWEPMHECPWCGQPGEMIPPKGTKELW